MQKVKLEEEAAATQPDFSTPEASQGLCDLKRPLGRLGAMVADEVEVSFAVIVENPLVQCPCCGHSFSISFNRR